MSARKAGCTYVRIQIYTNRRPDVRVQIYLHTFICVCNLVACARTGVREIYAVANLVVRCTPPVLLA